MVYKISPGGGGVEVNHIQPVACIFISTSDEKVPQRMLELKYTLLKQKYTEIVIDAGI